MSIEPLAQESVAEGPATFDTPTGKVEVRLGDRYGISVTEYGRQLRYVIRQVNPNMQCLVEYHYGADLQPPVIP